MIFLLFFILSLYSVEIVFDDFSKGSSENLELLGSSLTLSGLSFSNSGSGSWKYCESFEIQNKSTDTYTDFQIKISTSFEYSNMNADGSDIRFTEEDNEISYYIENWNDSGISDVWIKISSISANTSKEIKMYYGNSSATSNSSSDNTFLFYDNFSSDFDLDKWEKLDDYNEYDVKTENGKLVITGDEDVSKSDSYWSGVKLSVKNTLVAPLVIEYEIVPQTYVVSGRTTLFIEDGINNCQWGWLVSENDNINTSGRFNSNKSVPANLGGSVQVGTTYYYKIVIEKNGNASFYLDGNKKKTIYSLFTGTFTAKILANSREITGAKMSSLIDNFKIYRYPYQEIQILKKDTNRVYKSTGSYVSEEINFIKNVEIKGLSWNPTEQIQGTYLNFYLYVSSGTQWQKYGPFSSTQIFSYTGDKIKYEVFFKTDFSTKTPVLNKVKLNYETMGLYNSASDIIISTSEINKALSENSILSIEEVAFSTPIVSSAFDKFSNNLEKFNNAKIYYLKATDIFGNETSLLSPIVLKFSYKYLDVDKDSKIDNANISVDKLRILKISDEGNSQILETTIDRTEQTLECSVDAFSYFLIVAFSDIDKFFGNVLIYPNPFSPGKEKVTVSYILKEKSEIEARIYTLTGELVKKFNFVEDGDSSGIIPTEFNWDGRNGKGVICSNGTYVLYIKAKTLSSGAEKEIIKKIAILK